MATLQQLEDALRKADAAGAVDDARMLANEIVRMRQAAPMVTTDDETGVVYKNGRIVYDPDSDPTNVTDPTQGMSTVGKFLAGAGGKFNRAGLAIKDIFVGADEELAAARERDRPLYDTTAGGLGGLVSDVAMSVPLLAAGGAIAAPLGMGAAATRLAAPAIGGALEMGLLKGTVGEEDRKKQAAGGAALGLLGEAVSRPLARVGKSAFGAARDKAISEIQKKGKYQVPSLAGGKSSLGALFESVPGKNVAEKASYANQANTSRLAKEALGIDLDTPLQEGISQMKRPYGEVMKKLESNASRFGPDQALAKDLADIETNYLDLIEAVPPAVRRPLESLFVSGGEPLNASQLVSLSRFARDKAEKAMRPTAEATDVAMGRSYRQIQNAIDDFLERKVGGKLSKELRDAKFKYAVASNIEEASVGELVDAHKLSRVMGKRSSRSPELNMIRQAVETIPELTKLTSMLAPTGGPLATVGGAIAGSQAARTTGRLSSQMSPLIQALGQQQNIFGIPVGTPAQAGILGIGLGQE